MTHDRMMNEHHVLTLEASMCMINGRHALILVCIINEFQEVGSPWCLLQTDTPPFLSSPSPWCLLQTGTTPAYVMWMIFD